MMNRNVQQGNGLKQGKGKAKEPMAEQVAIVEEIAATQQAEAVEEAVAVGAGDVQEDMGDGGEVFNPINLNPLDPDFLRPNQQQEPQDEQEEDGNKKPPKDPLIPPILQIPVDGKGGEECCPTQPKRGNTYSVPDGYMTDSVGKPVANDTNSLTVGRGGPVLIQDVHLIEKLAHFDRERVPERVVHAKGAGAFGHFEACGGAEKYTVADFMKKGQRTKTFARFSTVVGAKGSADTARDPRGFAVKFYTSQGVYDLVGNNLPVFFIRDAVQFPDLIHSLKPAPNTNIKDVARFWDFISHTPEAMHMITWVYSDRGTIKSYRHMDGFGVNTYIWVCPKGVRRFVKYHWKTMQGLQTIDRHEADKLAGRDPDVATRDLHKAIADGEQVKYELYVQIMEQEQAESLCFDPLDDTKLWSEEKFPLIKVGMLTLDKNPDNFFAQVEQAAFCPANLVDGIELSADKMLQGRSFAYLDTQRYRIGPNFAQLPINRSQSPVFNNQRDGAMTFEVNADPVNYSPNTLGAGTPKVARGIYSRPLYVEGQVERETIEKTDDFKQAGEHYFSLCQTQREHLADNIADELRRVPKEIREKILYYLDKCALELGAMVRELCR